MYHTTHGSCESVIYYDFLPCIGARLIVDNITVGGEYSTIWVDNVVRNDLVAPHEPIHAGSAVVERSYHVQYTIEAVGRLVGL